MAIFWQKLMDVLFGWFTDFLASLLGGVLCLALLVGCQTSLKGEGSVGFRQSTSWEVYHEAKDTNENQHAESELSFDDRVMPGKDVADDGTE
jgi:hypothetical protein